MAREAGILMPITSLPSPYGIGTLGKEAREFADFLKKAGQKIWQIIPVVGMQEVLKNQLDDLKNRLPQYRRLTLSVFFNFCR